MANMLAKPPGGECTHIASTARICIRQPSSTNVLALLNEFKVTYAELSNDLYCEAETTWTRTYDEYLCIERHGENVLRQWKNNRNCCVRKRTMLSAVQECKRPNT
jgi:hypothetical protein